MCGIIGLVDDRQKLGARMRILRAAMAKRGPDGEGEYIDHHIALGMRRLAIIDLKTGDQPMEAAKGQILAFQNGEIYNFRDLRRVLVSKGCHFVSQSDTEVLAHGYAVWGLAGLLDRLDGMYALAIFDRRKGLLHLARDPLGEKPLFIAQRPQCFAFASSLLPLAALPWVDQTIDPRALDQYLALHYVPGDATILKGIRRILPGEAITLSIESLKVIRSRYYRPKTGAMRPLEVETLSAMIEQAVCSRLVADVKVGVFLSGGVDSSLVSAIAAPHSPGIRTFSMGFADQSYDESAFADVVARHVGSEHTRFIFDRDSFADLIPEVAGALDEPLGDQALLPLYWLARAAATQVKVVLSGEGADELFGGYFYYEPLTRTPYRSHAYSWLRGLLSAFRGQRDCRARFLDATRNATPSGFPLAGELYAREVVTKRRFDDPSSWEVDVLQWLERASCPLQRARAADVATWLPDDLLVKLDRMTMAHSIEGRAPYLQRALVDAALALPDEQIISNGKNKHLLRQVAERWLPPEIFQRPKQGFNLPMRQWLGNWIEKQGGARTYFSGVSVLGLDGDATSELVGADLAAGTIRDRFVMALILLIEWHRGLANKTAALERALSHGS